MQFNCRAIGFRADSTAALVPRGSMSHSEWEANGSVAVHGPSSTSFTDPDTMWIISGRLNKTSGKQKNAPAPHVWRRCCSKFTVQTKQGFAQLLLHFLSILLPLLEHTLTMESWRMSRGNMGMKSSDPAFRARASGRCMCWNPPFCIWFGPKPRKTARHNSCF